MIPPFDLFSTNSEGELVWQAMVESLHVARLRIKILQDAHPGDYVIRSQRTGHNLVIKADGSITGSPGPSKSEER